MVSRTVSVLLDSGITYVSGTVNGIDYTFTLTADNTWSAEVLAAEDNIYHLSLTAINSEGNVTTLTTTLYYGINLITDRSQFDVARYLELKAKAFTDMTEDEKLEWLSNLRGAYNFTDMNRVDGAIDYLVERLRQCGYYVQGVNTNRLWSMERLPKVSDLAAYLANVRTMRESFAVLESTPSVPDDMKWFTYNEANHIEQILFDIDFLITNMMQSWFYADDVFSGEV